MSEEIKQTLIEEIKKHKKLLIKASAGTGKTYTLTEIVTSLILNEESLGFFNILVLTFTNKAAGEMKERILNSLSIKKENLALESIFKIAKKEEMLEISTIHSFALKVLNSYQEELNILSTLKIKENCEEIIKSLIFNFLRSEGSFNSNTEEIQYFKGNFKTTEDLVEQVIKYFEKDINEEMREWLEEQSKIFEPLLNETKLQSEIKNKYRDITQDLIKISPLKIKKLLSSRQSDEILQEEINSTLENSSIFNIALEFCEKNLLSRIYTKEKKLKESKKESLDLDLKILLEKVSSLGKLLSKYYYEGESGNKSKLKDYIKLKYIFKIISKLEKDLNTLSEKSGIISYNQSIHFLNKKLKENPDFRKSLRASYDIILIDEFQDMDRAQSELFKLICEYDGDFKPLVLIGDPKQIIYSFRGSDISIYKANIKNAKESSESLKVNYRTTKSLLKNLNTIFKEVYKISNSEAEKIEFEEAESTPDERDSKFYIEERESSKLIYIKLEDKNEEKVNRFNFIARHILKIFKDGLLESAGERKRIKLNDIAVLARKKSELKKIKEELEKLKLKTIEIEENIEESKEFLEIFNIIKCLDKKRNFVDLPYVLNSFIINLSWNFQKYLKENDLINEIEAFFSQISNDLSENKINIIEAVKKIEFEKNLWKRLMQNYPEKEGESVLIPYSLRLIRQEREDVLESYKKCLDFISKLYSEENSITELISTLENIINKEETIKQIRKEREDAIKLMTIHSSKGLSFSIVYVVNEANLEIKKEQDLYYKYYEGEKLKFDFFKVEREKNLNKKLSEEKNLFYVASTRAKDVLVILRAEEKSEDKANKILNIIFKEEYLANLDYQLITQETNLKVINVESESKEEIELDENIREAPKIENQILYNYSFSSITKDLYEHLEDENLEEEPLLPKGAVIGSITHEIIENIEFKEEKRDDFFKKNKDLIEKIILKNTSYSNTDMLKYAKKISNMIFNSLSIKLPGIEKSLFEIKNLKKEVPFSFKINPKNSNLKNLEDLSKITNLKMHKGFIRGVIDLVFESEGKIYILDWKTNFIGNKKESYNREALKASMQEHLYNLQYTIYSIAVSLIFKDKINLENDFKEIIYLYTRAFLEESERNYGIYKTNVDWSQIKSIKEELGI